MEKLNEKPKEEWRYAKVSRGHDQRWEFVFIVYDGVEFEKEVMKKDFDGRNGGFNLLKENTVIQVNQKTGLWSIRDQGLA